MTVTEAVDEVNTYQTRVCEWLLACFGNEIARDRAVALVDYVFSRPPGQPAQEVGGVMTTLAALCAAVDIDMAAAGETELARVWTKIDAIRAKQAAKPVGSALPQ